MVKKKINTHKHLIAGSVVVGVAIAGTYACYHYSEIYPSTDNAYINANLVNVAPKVAGYIQKIYVKEDQFVHKGDLLMELDPEDYALELTKSRQDLALAGQQAQSYQQQIASSKANVVKAKSDYAFAQQMATRYANLYQQQAGSLQDMQKYQNQASQAKQVLDQAQVALGQALTQYQAASTQIAIAKSNVDNAQNHTGYTQLRAAVDGYISNLNLQSGEFVAAGQKIFGLVDDNEWWVDANFKETQLKYIKAGQPASISLDMYDHKYSGVVQSISYASGNTFSLLPAQNATGNWVKVTQRFTVRVKLQNNSQFPLRVGASCKVSVDTSKIQIAGS